MLPSILRLFLHLLNLQVAQRVRSIDHLRAQAEAGRKRLAVRYTPVSLDEEVYLHPRCEEMWCSKRNKMYIFENIISIRGHNVLKFAKRQGLQDCQWYLVRATSSAPSSMHTGPSVGPSARLESCVCLCDIRMHRSSLSRSPPEYAIYLQLLRTDKRPYMVGVTGIQVGQSSNCHAPSMIRPS